MHLLFFNKKHITVIAVIFVSVNAHAQIGGQPPASQNAITNTTEKKVELTQDQLSKITPAPAGQSQTATLKKGVGTAVPVNDSSNAVEQNLKQQAIPTNKIVPQKIQPSAPPH